MERFWLDLAGVTEAEMAATPELDWPDNRRRMLPIRTLANVSRDLPLAVWPDLAGVVVRWGDVLLEGVIDWLKIRLGLIARSEAEVAEALGGHTIRIILPDGVICDSRIADLMEVVMGKGVDGRLTKSWSDAGFSRSEIDSINLFALGQGFCLRVTRVAIPI